MIDLGTLYQRMNRPNDAIKIYKKLLEFYPDNIAVKIRLANLYTKLGLEKEAAQDVLSLVTKPKRGYALCPPLCSIMPLD